MTDLIDEMCFRRRSYELTIVLKQQIKPPRKIAHMAFHNLLD